MAVANPTDNEKVIGPWSKQEAFLAAPEGYGTKYYTEKKYHAFVSGIGAGKTVAGILRVVKNVEDWNPGEVGMIVAPNSVSIKNIIIPEMQRLGLFEHAGWELFGPQSEQPGIHTPNGSRVLLGSADNDRQIERLRGPSLAWFWIDEAAIVPPKAWDIMIGRLRRGNYRNAFITTTPKGYNWVYERFSPESEAYQERVERGKPHDVNLVYGIKSTENPHVPDDYAEITDEYDGSHYAQEVEGLFVQFEGLIYPWFDYESHVVAANDLPVNRHPEVFYGLDVGHRNPSALIPIVPTRTGELTVPAEFYARRCTSSDLSSVALDMYDEFGEGPVYVDSAAPETIDQLNRDGVNALKANKDVTAGIMSVSSVCSPTEDGTPRLLVSETAQSFINEIRQYQYDPDSEKDAPVKVNDHAMDAFRYAIHTHMGDSLNVGVSYGDAYDRRYL